MRQPIAISAHSNRILARVSVCDAYGGVEKWHENEMELGGGGEEREGSQLSFFFFFFFVCYVLYEGFM